MVECNYLAYYPDVKTGIENRFKCTENECESGKCKFHAEKYLQKHRQEVIQAFSQKLDDAKKAFEINKEPLLCIGYRLPSISIVKEEDNEFKIPVYFIDAKFKENIDFSHIVFKNKVSFHKAEFSGIVNFRDTVFEKDVDFSHSKFLSKTKKSNSFQSTKFMKSADFTYTSFKSNVDFSLARFYETRFAGCVFNKKIRASDVIFSYNVNFRRTWFFDSVDFSKSNFEKVVNFEDAHFEKFANFSNVEFKEAKNVTFNGNISNVSFLDTSVKHIHFGNKISWEIKTDSKKIKKELHTKKRKNNDYKIYEERLLEENNETIINLESIKNIYRDLRDNFDLNLRYDTAGEFFVREMELKRKYEEKHMKNKLITTKKPVCSRTISLYWLYNIVAQYGQSYYRPMYFAIPIISIGTFLFWTECISQEKINPEFICDGFLYAFIRSLSSFIPFFTFSDNPNTLDYVLRLILLPISGTLFIALKRKFERKLRH